MMLPWQKAHAWLAKHFPNDSFEEILAHYLTHGFVWSSPISFALFKPVFWDGQNIHTGTENWNAWFAHLAAGDLQDCFTHVPFTLEFVLFQRHGKAKIHAYNFQHLTSKVYGIVNT